MSYQEKQASKIYDRFRTNDDQINFLMSEKGEMSLDREIVKMMKQMEVDEILEFANQFFKFTQNQSSSLQTLVSNELNKRKDQCQEIQNYPNNQQESFFTLRKNTKNQQIVSNLTILPDIFKEMNKIQQALEQDFTLKTQKQSNQTSNLESDYVDFQKYDYNEKYVPQILPDQDYLNATHSDQIIQFDRLPAYLLLQNNPNLIQPNQNLKPVSQIKIIIDDTFQIQQQKVKIIETKEFNEKNILMKQPEVSKNANLNETEIEQIEQIDQNYQQILQQNPTTVQENQQLDFQEVQRISLPDNKFKITYNNGDQYEGQLENQMKNGWGDYHYNTGQRYQGLFVDDQIQGYGQYFFLSGASYEGDWSSGMKHGIGILKFSSGDLYQGQFVKDHFHGKGTYNYANGDIFTGLWKNGQKHGKGKLETYDGSLQIGNWVNDKFQI